jgi:hypothetical protein
MRSASEGKCLFVGQRPADHLDWNFLCGLGIELVAFLKLAFLSGNASLDLGHHQEVSFDNEHFSPARGQPEHGLRTPPDQQN